MAITTGQPRSLASDDDFTPPPWFLHCAESLYQKTSRKNFEFSHGFMMPQFFIKKKRLFLPVR
jgi:hypothetical protein